MYLITVEGGDGSGKGEAVRIIAELLNQYPFSDVHLTHEPRRHSELGKLALESVKIGNKTPLQEAGLFAADRLDHSHTWIRPKLERGEVVVTPAYVQEAEAEVLSSMRSAMKKLGVTERAVSRLK